MKIYCPNCRSEPEHVENPIGRCILVYCRACNHKTAIHPPEVVTDIEWWAVDYDLMKREARRLQHNEPKYPGRIERRKNPKRPVLDALARAEQNNG